MHSKLRWTIQYRPVQEHGDGGDDDGDDDDDGVMMMEHVCHKAHFVLYF